MRNLHFSLLCVFLQQEYEISWRKLSLTLAKEKSGAIDQLLNELDDAFIIAEYPEGAAVYSHMDFEKRTSHYYISPEAMKIRSALQLRWDTIECMEPGPCVVRLFGRPETKSH
jgi:hypothetical protein